MKRTLVIECLGYERNKAFGFNEYLMNLLDYFYAHRETLDYEAIVIACQKSQYDSFAKYSDKFEIRCSRLSENYFGKLVVMTLISYWLHLSRHDTILFPGNYSEGT